MHRVLAIIVVDQPGVSTEDSEPLNGVEQFDHLDSFIFKDDSFNITVIQRLYNIRNSAKNSFYAQNIITMM